MQFTFKREAAFMAIFLIAPFLLGLFLAVLFPLFLR
jgi:hypothetical protein